MPRQPKCICGECATCKSREKARRFRAENPDYSRKYAKRHRAANLEHYREVDRLRAIRESESRTARAKAWREANPERVREQARKRREKENFQDLNRERMRRHRERHPGKNQARQKLQDAVRRGIVSRQPCEVCGSQDTDAHHSDYSKPLDVRWLCRTHHLEAHDASFTPR